MLTARGDLSDRLTGGVMQQLGHHRFAIVGSGFSGLGAAIRLKQEGIEDFVVLERAAELGGTWRDNTYPGCACDVPSHLYSFSFAPNPDWSRTFSRQPEIWAYLRRTAREQGVDAHIRYRHEVTSASWDATRELWQIETSAGELTASMLVVGAGPLAEPKLPAASVKVALARVAAVAPSTPPVAVAALLPVRGASATVVVKVVEPVRLVLSVTRIVTV